MQGPGGYKKGGFSTELPDCFKSEAISGRVLPKPICLLSHNTHLTFVSLPLQADMKEQLFACFCICFSLAQTGHRVNVCNFPAVIVIFILVGAVAYFTAGVGFIVWAIISLYVRVKFREIYGMDDGFNWGYDCCLSLFCNPCTLAQMRIHVEAGEKGFFSKPDVIEELSLPATPAAPDAKV